MGISDTTVVLNGDPVDILAENRRRFFRDAGYGCTLGATKAILAPLEQLDAARDRELVQSIAVDGDVEDPPPRTRYLHHMRGVA